MALVSIGLFLGIVIAEGSNGLLKEIPASEILAKIQNAEPVFYDHVKIKGNLDISQLNLPTNYVSRTPYEIKFLGLSEKVKLISSLIEINDSTIDGITNFNNVQFQNRVAFENTSFNGLAKFSGSKFNENVSFNHSEFNGPAEFVGSEFNGTSDVFLMNSQIALRFWHVQAMAQASASSNIKFYRNRESNGTSRVISGQYQIVNITDSNVSQNDTLVLYTYAPGASVCEIYSYQTIIDRRNKAGRSTSSNTTKPGNLSSRNLSEIHDINKTATSGTLIKLSNVDDVDIAMNTNKSISHFLASNLETWDLDDESISNFWDPRFDFSQWGSKIVIDFSESRFNSIANFEDAKFNKPVDFGNSKFDGIAMFENSEFDELANFGHSLFNVTAKFGGSKFNKHTDFSNSVFCRDLNTSRLSIESRKYIYKNVFQGTQVINAKRSAEFYQNLNSSSQKGSDILHWYSQISADFWGSDFNESSNFGNCTFNGGAFYKRTQFRGPADFVNSTFDGLAYFGDARFDDTANFGYSKFNGTFDKTEFDGTGYFFYSQFNRPVDVWFWDSTLTTYFMDAKFNGPAYFGNSRFNKTITFANSKFNGTLDFEASKFNDFVDFENIKFNKEVKFNDAEFNGHTSFNSSQFIGDALFLNTTFKDTIYLTRSRYDKLYIRWNSIKSLGYDDTTYQLMIENFKKLGLFNDADNCYYQYRKELRIQPDRPFQDRVIDQWLEYLYGYGVKPFNSLLPFGILVVIFGFIWSSLIISYRFSTKDSTPPWKLLAIFSFSVQVFLSGMRLFVQPPKPPKLPGKWGNVVSILYTAERIFGASLFFLFIIAIGRTIIR